MVVESVLAGGSGHEIESCDTTARTACVWTVLEQLAEKAPPEGERDGKLNLAMMRVTLAAGGNCTWEHRLGVARRARQAVESDPSLLPVVRTEVGDYLQGVPDYQQLVGALDVET